MIPTISFLQNKVRKKGLLDREDKPNAGQIEIFREVHLRNQDWVAGWE